MSDIREFVTIRLISTEKLVDIRHYGLVGMVWQHTRVLTLY